MKKLFQRICRLFGFAGREAKAEPLDLAHLSVLADEAHRLIDLLVASRVSGVLETHDPLMAYMKTQEFDPGAAVVTLRSFLRGKQGKVYSPAPGAGQLSYFIWTFKANVGYGTPDWVTYEQIATSSVANLRMYEALLAADSCYDSEKMNKFTERKKIIRERINMIFSTEVAEALFARIMKEFEQSREVVGVS